MAQEISCLFICQNPKCGVAISLPHGSLGHIFSAQPLRTIDAPFLAAPCPICKRVGNHSLHKGSKYYHPRNQLIWEDPTDTETVFLNWLECVDRDCRSHVPLFARWSATTSGADRIADIQTWKWDGLLCPEGHLIRVPVFRVDSSTDLA